MTIRFRESPYRPQSDDTSVEADRLMFDLYRQLAPADRCARVVSAALLERALSEAGLEPPE